MPRPCSICVHPNRAEIDAALVAGEPYRGIAQRFAASADAVLRHKAHLPRAMVAALEAGRATGEVAAGDHLLAEVQRLRSEAQRLGLEAEKAGDLRTALAAVREQTRIVELLAELAKVAATSGAAPGLAQSPEWLTLRTRILAALEEHPAALDAMREALANG